MSDWGSVLERAESLLQRLESYLPERAQQVIDWKKIVVSRWRFYNDRGFIQPVEMFDPIHVRDLSAIDDQIKLVEMNTRQFIAGLPSNNVLLTGSKGTGKSSLVKALLNKYAKKDLRLIEVDKAHLHQLPQIIDLVSEDPYRFIIFCDDLSFGSDDDGYKTLKVALDGSVATTSENILIYATSNRRHLLPEYMSENLESTYKGEEIHAGENVEEKISLSERFGVWVHFDGFTQEEYIKIASYWVKTLSRDIYHADEGVIRRSLQWALERGSRSGRVAYQFAKNEVGSRKLKEMKKNRAR
ncbi:MAG: ATP-binding protein [Burkholderiales bacterium]|nr:ATP-binding protein [Burkholderiales bacterium]OUT76596.1 MAG: AAA family ATPase [Betaproteobacteria bacterium TMED22]|tara:strand:+ start:75 stop:971 length:897 start_codon:yes stop_codon:yes gene_type:complete